VFNALPTANGPASTTTNHKRKENHHRNVIKWPHQSLKRCIRHRTICTFTQLPCLCPSATTYALRHRSSPAANQLSVGEPRLCFHTRSRRKAFGRISHRISCVWVRWTYTHRGVEASLCLIILIIITGMENITTKLKSRSSRSAVGLLLSKPMLSQMADTYPMQLNASHYPEGFLARRQATRRTVITVMRTVVHKHSRSSENPILSLDGGIDGVPLLKTPAKPDEAR